MSISKRLTAFRAANGQDSNGMTLADAAPSGRRFDNLMARINEGTRHAAKPAVLNNAATPPPAPKSPPAPTISQADIVAARKAAGEAERARWQRVMAHPMAKGREEILRSMLSSAQFTEAEIIRDLPHLSTDAERSAAASRAAADAVWDKVWAGQNAKVAAARQSKTAGNAGANDVWSRAYAIAQGGAR